MNYKGRATFEFILSQVEDCIFDISPLINAIPENRIYNPEFYQTASRFQKLRPQLSLKQLALCDLAYSIVFYGMSYHDSMILTDRYTNYYNIRFLKYVVYYCGMKPHPDHSLYSPWKKEFDINYFTQMLADDIELHELETPRLDTFQKLPPTVFYNIIEQRPFKFYGGHQHKLGHYYRHLFQTVHYINNQQILTYAEKYDYIKTLRAQLSTPEQYLLFFNSISTMGRKWELRESLSQEKAIDYNKLLITKYNLVKNIPQLNFVGQINIDHFYPMVNFEINTPSELRLQICKYFC